MRDVNGYDKEPSKTPQARAERTANAPWAPLRLIKSLDAFTGVHQSAALPRITSLQQYYVEGYSPMDLQGCGRPVGERALPLRWRTDTLVPVLFIAKGSLR